MAIETFPLGPLQTNSYLVHADGMAVAVCHYFATRSTINALTDGARFKGLGGGLKAVSKRGSQSWEHFLDQHPDREIKPATPPKTRINKITKE